MLSLCVALFLSIFSASVFANDFASNFWQPTTCPERCACSFEFNERLQAKLRTVNCESLQLTTFPSSIPRDTQVLLLRGNNIQRLQDLSEDLPDLLQLDLSHNSINAVTSSAPLEGMYNLRILDLHDNQLTHLNSDVFQGLFKLEELVLSSNRIAAMGNHVFRGLEKLHVLHLSRNKLTYIQPDWWTNVPGLFQLHLDQNYLTYLQSDALAPLVNLHILDLSHNKLFKLSKQSLVSLQRLETLRMASNFLPEIPSLALCQLRSLRSLNLANNPVLQVATGDFASLPLLKDIMLTNMPKLSLVNKAAFADLPALLVLQLHDNPMLSFVDPDAIRDCASITHLLLHNNNISAIQRRLVDSVPSIQELSFYGNPLACDCNSRWLREFIDTPSGAIFREAERMVCDQPKDTQYKLFVGLSADDLSQHCAPQIVPLFDAQNVRSVFSEIRLDCRALGLPTPMIRWITPANLEVSEQFLADNPQFSLVDGNTLVIRNIKTEDAGIYTCFARNRLGEMSASAELEVKTIEVSLFPVRIGPSSATLVWSTDDKEVRSFQILYRALDGGNKETRHQFAGSVTPDMRTYNLRNLQPDTQYEVCMASEEKDILMHITCTRFTTKQTSLLLQGVERTGNIAVGVALGIMACLMIVICLVFVGLKNNQNSSYSRLDQLARLETGTGGCYSKPVSVEPTPAHGKNVQFVFPTPSPVIVSIRPPKS